jgi:hypothetical protein
MRMKAIMIATMLAVALPASAQRTAVSAGLSPEMAGEAFARAVLDVCVPAVGGNGVSSLGAARTGKLNPTQDAEVRRQAGASADETVWELAEGAWRGDRARGGGALHGISLRAGGGADDRGRDAGAGRRWV